MYTLITVYIILFSNLVFYHVCQIQPSLWLQSKKLYLLATDSGYFHGLNKYRKEKASELDFVPN